MVFDLSWKYAHKHCRIYFFLFVMVFLSSFSFSVIFWSIALIFSMVSNASRLITLVTPLIQTFRIKFYASIKDWYTHWYNNCKKMLKQDKFDWNFYFLEIILIASLISNACFSQTSFCFLHQSFISLLGKDIDISFKFVERFKEVFSHSVEFIT